MEVKQESLCSGISDCVGHLQPAAQAADEGVLGAPVELEGFTPLELERDKRATAAVQGLVGLEAPGEGGNTTITAAVTHGGEFLVHGEDGTSLALATMLVGFMRIPAHAGPAFRLMGVHDSG